jgi:lipoprotein signal peptidase
MIFYITLISSIIIDLATKQLAKVFIDEKINILWDLVFIKYIENTWIAFSINIPFLKILTIILIIWIFYYYFKEEKIKKSKLIDLSFWFILWWAVWNWIERVLNWKVIDFIWIKWFAIFNMADIFISIWAIIYLIYILKCNK